MKPAYGEAATKVKEEGVCKTRLVFSFILLSSDNEQVMFVLFILQVKGWASLLTS